MNDARPLNDQWWQIDGKHDLLARRTWCKNVCWDCRVCFTGGNRLKPKELAKCHMCGQWAARVNADFRPPKRSSLKAWQRSQRMFSMHNPDDWWKPFVLNRHMYTCHLPDCCCCLQTQHVDPIPSDVRAAYGSDRLKLWAKGARFAYLNPYHHKPNSTVPYRMFEYRSSPVPVWGFWGHKKPEPSAYTTKT